MKKLNRKGFTLIELLAIIVILAIIMVVTIPTVLSSMGNARQETLNTSANTVADWIEKEYTMAQLGTADTAFVTICGAAGKTCLDPATAVDIKSALDDAGVDPTNYSSATVKIKASGRACVTLTASDNGDFSNVDSKTVKSIGCTQ